MSTPSQHQGTAVTDTRRKDDAHPAPAPRPPGWSASGHGIVSLCLAAASFVSAPFLMLIPVAGFIPAILAAAGTMFAWIGLRESDRTPGLAVAGLIISVMLFGLTLSIAMLWTLQVVVPAVRDYSELQEVIDHVGRMLIEDLVILPDTGGRALLGLLAGALLVVGGLLLRRRNS